MTRSGPALYRPRRRLSGLLRVLATAALLGAPTVLAASAAGTLYAGPATDTAFTVITPRLLNALYPDQRLNAEGVADDAAALDHVAADPTSAAVADLVAMVQFAASKKLPPERLEFHGPLEQHCLLAFAQRDGWVHAFSDLITAEGSPRPVVGLAGSAAVSLFTMMRKQEPGLAAVMTQSGDPDALAQQVKRGALDALLIVVYRDLDHDLVVRLADDDHLTPLPVVTRLLSHAALDRNTGFNMEPVRTDSGLMPWGRPKPITFCTPTGVVLRGDAPPALRDAVNRAVPKVADSLHQSLTDRVSTATTNTLHDALDTVQGLITRLRSN